MSEFGTAPVAPPSDDEANVSPFEVNEGALPSSKRFRGLEGSSRDIRAYSESLKRKRHVDVATMRFCRKGRSRPRRELRPLRSDASVELNNDVPTVGPALRSRIAASWLTASHRRLIDDTGLAHWRSGQVGGNETSSTQSSDNDVEGNHPSPAL